jgi:hypothetical protein
MSWLDESPYIEGALAETALRKAGWTTRTGSGRRAATRYPFHVHGPITAAELRAAIHQAFDPVLSAVGFAWVADLKWVRNRTPLIRDIVEAYGGRQGRRATRWGVSLDFVPHVEGTAIRWHRTAKSARIDLGYDPSNFRDPWDVASQEWVIAPDLGSPTPAARAAAIASLLDRTALSWLEPITGLVAVREAFERERGRTGGQFAFDDYIQYPLAYAFTLACTGSLDRAELELDRWAARSTFPIDVRNQLRGLLQSTTPEERG